MNYKTLIFSFLCFVSSIVYAQNQSIDLPKGKSLTIEKVFQEIEKQTNLSVDYTDSNIRIKDKVQIKSKTLTKILAEILTPRKLVSTISNGTLFITPLLQGDKTFKGKILDENGEPIIGANIMEQGTRNGTITDIDGEFVLKLSKSQFIKISYIGYNSIVYNTQGKGTGTIELKNDNQLLDEVVVVGFGVQKKENLTGAASTVKMDDVLGNRPVTNALQALQGAMPGLQITANSGEPGAAGLDLNIRGFTSINGGSPLVLMDNVPVDIADVNPQDIESVSVLKDASASAIYGARAAFGVVLITTKKAKKGQPIKFNYSMTLGFNEPVDMFEMASNRDFVHALQDWGVDSYWTGQDVDKWVNFVDDYQMNPSKYPDGMATDENGLKYPLANRDAIKKYLEDRGVMQIHNFSFSGGSKKSAYRVSASYSDEDGIVVTDNDSFKKYNVKSYLMSQLTSNLRATLDLNLRRSKKSEPNGGYSDALYSKPWERGDGNYTLENGETYPLDTPKNMESLNPSPKVNVFNVRALGKLEYEPIKDLVLTAEYTFEKSNWNRKSQNNQVQTISSERLSKTSINPEETYFRKENRQFTYNALNVYARYTKSFNKKHNFAFLLGANNEKKSIEYFHVKRKGLISVDYPAISTATGLIDGADAYKEWVVFGAFGRINYNYQEKYFLELSGRYDGSSKFPTKSRFGFFPSFSLGWNIKREAFMQKVDFISSLKLRGSYGVIGNQNVGGSVDENVYIAIPGMEVGDASWFNPGTSMKYTTLGTPQLVSSSFTWEKVKTRNIGLDFGFLNNRLSGSFDVFERRTEGMLVPGSQLPAVLGASAPKQNAADLKSTGWELELTWRDKIKDFSYSIGVTLFDDQAEITRFKNKGGLLNQYYVGRKIGEIWGYVTDRYYTVDDFVAGTLDNNLKNGTLKDGIPAFRGHDANPGDILFKDLDGDGEIYKGDETLGNPGDRKVIGNSHRRYQYGIFGSMGYKNFDFSFAMNGVGKRDVYINNVSRFPYTGEFSTMFAHQTDYWTPENPNAFYPRNYSRGSENYGINRQTQTKYLVDGSYLNIKNITLGYTLPFRLLKRWGITKLRFYTSIENLHCFNNWDKGINTELKDKGRGSHYPLLRTYSFGLNLSF